MVRREAAEQVGFLDPEFFVYSDETDFCKRLRDAGWRILYVPDARAIHHDQLGTDPAACDAGSWSSTAAATSTCASTTSAPARLAARALGGPTACARGAGCPATSRALPARPQELRPGAARGSARRRRPTTAGSRLGRGRVVESPRGGCRNGPYRGARRGARGRCSCSPAAAERRRSCGIGLLGAVGELGLALATGSDANGLDALASPAGAGCGPARRGAPSPRSRRSSCAARRCVPIVVLAAAPLPAAVVLRSRGRGLLVAGRRGRPARAPAAAVLRARGGHRSRSSGGSCGASAVARATARRGLPAAAFLAVACLSLLWRDGPRPGVNLLVLHAARSGRCWPWSAGRPSRTVAAASSSARGGGPSPSCSRRSACSRQPRCELFFFAPNLELSNANSVLLPRHVAVRPTRACTGATWCSGMVDRAGGSGAPGKLAPVPGGRPARAHVRRPLLLLLPVEHDRARGGVPGRSRRPRATAPPAGRWPWCWWCSPPARRGAS